MHGAADDGRGAAGEASYYVVLEDPPAVKAVLAREGKLTLAAVDREARRVARRQVGVEEELARLGLRVEYRYRRLANAIQVRVGEEQLGRLRGMRGVRRVERVPVALPDRAHGVPLIGAQRLWGAAGPNLHGEGMTVGVVDTGIDYTHADFAGPGTVESYQNNDRNIVEPGTFPTAKVIGGTDLVGDAYPGTFTPDDDPLDCGGHGTMVSGIVAGLGLLAEGGTYSGPYGDDLNLAGFRIAPGAAPAARLVAVKVFGCSGSTEFVGAALEWLSDPANYANDGRLVDVVNVSIGSPFAANASLVEWSLAKNLTELGVLIVATAGNSGNTFFIMGGISSYPEVLSSAAAYDDVSIATTLDVIAPAELAGTYEAREGSFCPSLEENGAVAGTVVLADPPDGCSAPLNGDALAGHIALVRRGGCPFDVKTQNVQDAGALAVIVANNIDQALFVMGSSGTPGLVIDIPAVLITRETGLAVEAALVQGGVDVELAASTPLTDVVAGFSSRGPQGVVALLKPDLTAPGVAITSARVGTGSQAQTGDGTSFAAPFISGAAALVRQARPELSPAEVKALLMNTAAPLHSGSGGMIAESLGGAGSLRVDRAVASKVVAMDADASAAVSLSFGSLHFAQPGSARRNLRVKNLGAEERTLALTVRQTVDEPGVMVRLLDTTLVLAPSQSGSAGVRLEVDPRLFDRSPDATVRQLCGSSGESPLLCRWPTEVSGAIVLADENGEELIHVPYHALVTAGAETWAAASSLCASGTAGKVSVNIPLVGGSGHPRPILTGLELVDESPDQQLEDLGGASADVLAFGVVSDAARYADNLDDATLYFGVVTAAPWTTPTRVALVVSVDGDLDGSFETSLHNDNYGWYSTGQATQSSDSFITVVDRGGAHFDGSLINVFGPEHLDTALFDSNVMVIPVKAAALGLDGDHAVFDFRLAAYAIDGTFVDQVPAEGGSFRYDLAHPRVTFPAGIVGTPVQQDRGSLTVEMDAAALALPQPPRLLLLHHMNPLGRRHEVVSLLPAGTPSSDLALSLAPASPTAALGEPFTFDVVVANAGPDAAATAEVLLAFDGAVEWIAPPASCASTGGRLACALGSVDKGAASALSLSARPLAPGDLSLWGTAHDATSCEAEAEDNAARFTFSVVRRERVVGGLPMNEAGDDAAMNPEDAAVVEDSDVPREPSGCACGLGGDGGGGGMPVGWLVVALGLALACRPRRRRSCYHAPRRRWLTALQERDDT